MYGQHYAIIERLHRVMGDMLRCMIVSKCFKDDDPINNMLQAAAYGIRATMHGTTQYTPGQMVFNKDMVLRTAMAVDYEAVRQRREIAIKRNNIRENKRRISHIYKPGDKVLVLSKHLDPKLQPHEGPFKVQAYDKFSGTLRIKHGRYVEPINVRLVRPYFGH